MENEDFKIGDVIVEIGETQKFVVVCKSPTVYWTRKYPYEKRDMEMFPGGLPTQRNVIHLLFVKVDEAAEYVRRV
jgi:hypothetical protein